MFTRRHFLGASLAAPLAYAAGSFVPVWAQNAPNLGTPTLPATGFRRMKVGDVEVISLLDGVARRPLGEEFVKNAPLAEVRALLASQNLPTEYIDIPFTPFLVVAGNRRILMDTGLGDIRRPDHRQAAGAAARGRLPARRHRHGADHALPRRPHRRPAQQGTSSCSPRPR
jgi:hypothetical protein